MCRSEFLKEKSRSKTNPTIHAGPSRQQDTSSPVGGSTSSPQESDASLPQIRPYARKRPRDTNHETLATPSTVSAPSLWLDSVKAQEGRGELRVMDADVDHAGDAAITFDIKPYVKKRKTKQKQEN